MSKFKEMAWKKMPKQKLEEGEPEAVLYAVVENVTRPELILHMVDEKNWDGEVIETNLAEFDRVKATTDKVHMIYYAYEDGGSAFCYSATKNP